jgi:hypothetical protein
MSIWTQIAEVPERETLWERADLVLGVAHRAFVEPAVGTGVLVAES